MLRRSLECQHALGPGVAGELVGFLSRLGSPLGRHADRGAAKSVAGFSAHNRQNAPREPLGASRYALRLAKDTGSRSWKSLREAVLI
jgi:hypothetical protein